MNDYFLQHSQQKLPVPQTYLSPLISFAAAAAE